MATTATATLLPVVDCVGMTVAQLSMLAAITHIYGFKSEEKKIASISSAPLGPSFATMGGKAIFTSLVKLIPGPGYIVGTATGDTVGATLTYAMGKTYIEIMNKIAN